MTGIRTALAGVGSCASSFLQFVALSKQKKQTMPGLMYDRIGGYSLDDITFVAAFDVDRNKLDLDLAKAVFTAPTVATAHVYVEPTGVPVRPGPVLDGLVGRLADVIDAAPQTHQVGIEDVEAYLRQADADVLVCLLPTGATEAVRAYAEAAARARVAFINATPEPVVHDHRLAGRFAAAGVPLLGDDLRSHFGATTLHTALIELLQSRALTVTNTYQLNVGGNTDFLNLSDPQRSASKQRSKRNALFAAGIDASTVAAGPNGYVQYLGDTKTCFLRIEASSILDSTVSLEIRLQVEDSPNAAGVIANAVRVAKAASDRGLGGVIDDVCPFLFKSPPVGATESEGLRRFRAFVSTLDNPTTATGDLGGSPT